MNRLITILAFFLCTVSVSAQLSVEEMAEKGDTYFYGKNGVTQNYVEAVKWYRKAADQGYAPAQSNLGYLYVSGNGVAQSFAEGAKWFRKAAEQGLANAQFNLGYCYESGSGVAQDNTEAVKWYRKAADQGYPSAQYNLANCYKNGYGVAQDNGEAATWYRKAADQDNFQAQYDLGYCYYYGQGIAQDYAEAVKWYRKAAIQGYSKAQNFLGLCYHSGKGVGKDYVEAVKWYRMAADQGNVDAQSNLADCYYLGQGVAQNYAEAVKWYRKAADQNSAKAQCNLGICYKYGHGVAQDNTEAVRWYRKAADQGDECAQNNLANCYFTGQGVTLDINEAAKWYRKAADQGNENAKKQLVTIEKSLTLAKEVLTQTTNKTPQNKSGQATKTSPTPTISQKRLALVVGNSDYPDGRLVNPVNDARDISAKLKSLGFDVMPGTTNLDREGMDKQINAFIKKAKNYDVALFFYAGHAIQERGINYLIPAKDNIPDDAIAYRCTDMSEVMGRLKDSGVKTKIVILDACRTRIGSTTRGFGDRGLAAMAGSEGTFLVFATQPGKEAADGKNERNSPFTSVLLEEIDKPGVPIYQLFHNVKQRVAMRTNQQQIPSEVNSLLGDFYFKP